MLSVKSLGGIMARSTNRWHIKTAPQARRQGYATAITAALVAKLVELHFSTIVLNVFEDNSPAVRIYQRLGFQTRHRLWTGQGILS
jgi:ribosomal protein S18 acetylase RimI-like enzyme